MISKAQGPSFHRGGVCLLVGVSGHGQPYVALTRRRNHQNSKVSVRHMQNKGKVLSDDRTLKKKNLKKELRKN